MKFHQQRSKVALVVLLTTHNLSFNSLDTFNKLLHKQKNSQQQFLDTCYFLKLPSWLFSKKTFFSKKYPFPWSRGQIRTVEAKSKIWFVSPSSVAFILLEEKTDTLLVSPLSIDHKIKLLITQEIWIRSERRKISIGLEGHTSHCYDVCAYARKHACMLCMHNIFWCAQAPTSAKLGQIREIKVSMESGEYVGNGWAHVT